MASSRRHFGLRGVDPQTASMPAAPAVRSRPGLLSRITWKQAKIGLFYTGIAFLIGVKIIVAFHDVDVISNASPEASRECHRRAQESFSKNAYRDCLVRFKPGDGKG